VVLLLRERSGKEKAKERRQTERKKKEEGRKGKECEKEGDKAPQLTFLTTPLTTMTKLSCTNHHTANALKNNSQL